ncbi:amidohydrolase [Salmonella enterica subsp. enterica serovar Choleraesuis]|nr:amidohydrolase [Salmonella enterica subsp. enterica serovar Choleraesuis]
MSESIADALRTQESEWVALRHQLHQHPEVGFALANTSALVAEKLKSWGYELHQGMAETGIVATLKVGDGERRLGLRADMDALPIVENSGKAWASQTPGSFHGCGHDGHTAILLCAAEYLARTKNFNGTLHLIFQPAEELLYGGQKMVDDGLFREFPCDRIYALHNMPGMKKNHFYFTDGPGMASADTLEITIAGKGGHGAMPESTIDATLVACHVVTALQSIVSRNTAPSDAVVVTVGSLHSGSAPNVISERAVMQLSVRALRQEVRDKTLERISQITQNVAQGLGASAEIKLINACPVLCNDTEATAYLRQVANELFGESRVHTGKPLMGSEDFAFMLHANPNGSYVWLGAGDEPDRCMVHNPGYDFNDELIIPGAALWCALTERYLQA